MLRYLSADIICSEWRTVVRERSSRKTVSYKEQIMSLLSFKSFTQRAQFWKLGNILGYSPTLIFTHVTRLDQSLASENIRWIIRAIIPCPTNMVSVRLNFWGRFYFHFSLVFHDFEGLLIKQLLALVGYEMIKANSALRTSLAIYHFISNKREWNNF